METDLVLLPVPRRLALLEGRHRLSASQLRALLERDLGRAGVTLRIDPAQIAAPEGYRLLIRPGGVLVLARDAAGAFHAATTLRQIARQCGRSLPCLRLDDWPDFPQRGYMLDVSRDKVPRMATLLALVDLLADLKLNQLQLYTEHTFAYRRHRAVWRDASPLTASQIRRLDACCRARHIELVPNQNSFGHMERWLKHPAYRPLAECPDGFTRGDWKSPATTLCPTDPRSLRLVAELYAELLPNFTSRQLNAGCDETWELGQGRSAAECRRRGVERLYLEFLRQIAALAGRHGRTLQFWGDIIMHRPELIGELPANVIALEWGYEANHPFADHARQFAESGVPFYVCPGTSTWNTLTGRTDNALGNLRAAAEGGLGHGAVGYLVTDWGDNGHMQPLVSSYLPLAYGAAASWHLAGLAHLDLPAALDAHVFMDRAGVMGRLAWDLGNAYQHPGALVPNGSALGELLCRAPDSLPRWLKADLAEGYAASVERIREAVAPIRRARMALPDAALVKREFTQAADLLMHAARLGAARCRAEGLALAAVPARDRAALARELAPLLARHQTLWLQRHCPGGLPDSTARLERLLAAYRR